MYTRVGNHEDALEIVQESFLTLYQLCQSQEDKEPERALLFHLARNRAIDVLRRRRTRESFDQKTATGKVLLFRTTEPRTPEDDFLEQERLHCAATALAQLSERDQECLALRRSGLGYREVADVLQVNPNSIGQVIHRALRRFADAFEILWGKKGTDEKAGKTRRE